MSISVAIWGICINSKTKAPYGAFFISSIRKSSCAFAASRCCRSLAFSASSSLLLAFNLPFPLADLKILYSSKPLPPLQQPRVPPWGCACVLSCACALVRYCSRACALLSALSGVRVGKLSQSYPRFARLVLRSLRSPFSLSLSCVVGGVRGGLPSSHPSLAFLRSWVLACFALRFSLSLSLGYHSLSVLSRSSLLVCTLILRVLARHTLLHSLILREFVHSSLSYSDILIEFLTLSAV